MYFPRTLSVPVSLLVLSLGTLGIRASQDPPQTDQLAVATHALRVGQYHRFHFLSLIRLYTNSIFDPSEAKSAYVRCFHRLDEFDSSQRSQIMAGSMHIASKIDDAYYVVETPAVPHMSDPPGVPGTNLRHIPETWNIHSNATSQLETLLDRAGVIAASPPSDRDASWDRLTLDLSESPDVVLGVVPRDANNPLDAPCERIVSWTGDTKTLGHAGLLEPDATDGESPF